jgi:hypothetical protein
LIRPLRGTFVYTALAFDKVGKPFGSDKNWKLEPSTQVFLYPGPLFVQTVLQGIDAALDVTKIRTALRHVLKPKSKRKLKGKRKSKGMRKL